MGVALSGGLTPEAVDRPRGYAAAMTREEAGPGAELRPELRRGAELFDAGEWWEAHEAWEGEWMRAQGDERRFIQALILLAAALHKRWKMGSVTHRNFHKAAAYLDTLPGQYGGVDLVALRAGVWAALNAEGQRPQIARART